jgi:alkylation response protein AidB-like acyl-CoA dehydrogenase
MESPVGHAIFVHGTDEQRLRLLPSVPDQCEWYCVGFSESDHGSDLAAVQTRAEIIGSEIVVTGAKVWLAHADRAAAAFVLCRTEPAAARYQNLSCVLVPLHANHVELREVRQMSGDADFFDAVFDGARAPLDNVIGGRGNGWRVALTTLAFARADRRTLQQPDPERAFWDLVDTARRYRRDDDPLVRQQLAEAYAQARVLQLHHLRARTHPTAEASVTRLLRADYQRRLGEIGMHILGADALVRADGEAYAASHWQHVFLSSPAESLAAGTDEIQRTIIAERILGLPK